MANTNRYVTLTAKYGTEAVYLKKYTSIRDSKIMAEDFSHLVNESIALTAIDNLQKNIDIARMDNETILATFFQRVVSRTPVDEDYDTIYRYTGSGKKYKYHHNRDDSVCKLDWYIESSGKKMFVFDIIGAIGDVFKTYNDPESILKLDLYLANNLFKADRSGRVKAVIGNDNPHFAVLEFGGIPGNKNLGISNVKNPPELLSDEEGQKHQLKNSRSVQAPYGMLRITSAELETIKQEVKSKSKGVTSVKYSKQKTVKTPQKRSISKLTKMLDKNGSFKIDDLQELLK